VGNSDGFGFSWTKASGMVELADLGGGGSAANAVNPSGLVVGEIQTVAGGPHAALWRTTGR
jgi:hypothetical protein